LNNFLLNLPVFETVIETKTIPEVRGATTPSPRNARGGAKDQRGTLPLRKRIRVTTNTALQ